jgi:hypothetical protein
VKGYVVVVRWEPEGKPLVEVFEAGEAPLLAVIALLESGESGEEPRPEPVKQVRALANLRVRREPWGAVMGAVEKGSLWDVYTQVDGSLKEGKESSWLEIGSSKWICERWGREVYSSTDPDN